MTLTTGKLLRLAVQQLADTQNVSGFLDLLVDLRLGGLAQLEAERHIVVYCHVWIKRVALEHHGNVAILRGHVVDDPVADFDLTIGDFLQAGQQAQAGGLATTGRADEYQEFLVDNFNVEIVDCDDVTKTLVYVLVGYTGHRVIFSLLCDSESTQNLADARRAGQTELFGRKFSAPG